MSVCVFLLTLTRIVFIFEKKNYITKWLGLKFNLFVVKRAPCRKVEQGENQALNDWSRVKQFISFPENLNVARRGAEGNIERFVYKFMKINLASGQHSRVTVHCYPMTLS